MDRNLALRESEINEDTLPSGGPTRSGRCKRRQMRLCGTQQMAVCRNTLPKGKDWRNRRHDIYLRRVRTGDRKEEPDQGTLRMDRTSDSRRQKIRSQDQSYRTPGPSCRQAVIHPPLDRKDHEIYFSPSKEHETSEMTWISRAAVRVQSITEGTS